MKTTPLLSSTRIAVIASLIAVLDCFSADLEKAPAKEPTVPQSIFVVSKDAKDLRDPFYPNSTRLTGEVKSTPVTPPVVKVSLVLNGLSGAVGHRLAMINGRTMAAGESSDVPTDGSFVKVHCIEITGNSVVVEVNGAREVLSMNDEK